MNLNNIRMSVKLPVAFVTLSLIVALVISWMGYRDFRASLLIQREALLRTLAVERATAAETWIQSLDGQVRNYAADPTAIEAAAGFSSTFALLMEDPMRDLQQAYIHDNPHPPGEKDKLDRAEATVPYNFQHAKFHPVFRAIKNRLKLYDIFLIDPNGDIVYSAYKEADFATNLSTGAFQESGLADAYRAALAGAAGESFFADFQPYAPSGGDAAAFIASPIVAPTGETVGVLAVQLPANRLRSIVTNGQGLGETGDVTLIGEDMRARSASRFEDRHANFDPLDPNPIVAAAATTQTNGIFIDEAGLNGQLSMGVAYPIAVMGSHWAILAEFEMSEVLQAAVAQRNKTLLFTAVAMVAVAFCGWWVSRTFSDPLNVVVNAMGKISNREYDVTLPDLQRGDEIGALGRGLTGVSERLHEFDARLVQEQEAAKAQHHAVAELGSGLKRLANGDFSTRIPSAFAAEYEGLRHDYNETLERLGETIANLKDFSKVIGDQTDQMGRDSQELSQRTENQASTLEETAAALDQIAETIAQNSEELRSAETLIKETDSHVKSGRLVVENTTKAMDEIENSSKEIGSIIRVVDDIAFQTNLLALNAGVEAARAGDAGRGFAVVAAEVRQLAMRSTEAVSQIKSLIETSTANVGSGVSLVRETEAVLMEIVQRMEGISTAVSSVAAGATDQSGSISEINSGVNNLDRVTQQNAMMVENSNVSVQSLSSEASNLMQMLAAFQVATQDSNVVSLQDAAFTSRRSGKAT